jgi:hypothetical protein
LVVKIEINHIQCHVLGILGGNSAIEVNLDCQHVGSWCADIASIDDFVTTTGESDMVHFFLLWANVYNNAEIGGSLASRYFVMSNESDGISAGVRCWINAEEQLAHFVGTSLDPYIGIRPLHELLIVLRFAHVGIDDGMHIAMRNGKFCCGRCSGWCSCCVGCWWCRRDGFW